MLPPADASRIAEGFLADAMPDRWAHTRTVASQARTLATVVGVDVDLLEAACWLHDVGYAAELALVGFHPLDGARHLRDTDTGERRLWTLVANHSCAYVEAGNRRLGESLAAEFPVGPEGRLVTAITYCDMTSSPRGGEVSVDERIDEILVRYPPENVVHRSIAQASSEIRAQCAEITAALAGG